MEQTREESLPPPAYSVAHKLRVIATFLLAAWIVVSVLSHLVSAVASIGGPHPRHISVRMGWPVITHLASDGAVAPDPVGGVVPGTGTAIGDPEIGYECTWDEKGNRVCQCIPGVPDFVPEEVCILVAIGVVCFFIALMIGALLEWICSSEWVRDENVVRRCKRKKCRKWCLCCNKWICWLETVVQWIVRTICGWVEVIQWGTFLACVVAGVLIIFF